MKNISKLLAGVLATAMIFQTGISAFAVPAPSTAKSDLPTPKLYYDFEALTEGTLKDQSASGYDATASGTPAIVPGKKGNAISLKYSDSKSGDYFTLDNAVQLDYKDITISYWIKRETDRMVNEPRIFSTKPNATWNSPDGWFMGSLRGTTDEALAFIVSGANGAVYNQNMDEFYPKDEWVHIAATFDSAGKKTNLYKNGIRLESTNLGNGGMEIRPAQATAPKRLAASPYSATGLGGSIDEFMIFDTALSATQVAELAGLDLGAITDKLIDSDTEKLSIPLNATTNLSLPTKGANGSAIAWASNSPAVISDTGIVTRPEAGNPAVTVTLTATLSLENKTRTKTFTIKVLPLVSTAKVQDQLSADEIIDVSGFVGERVKAMINNYAFNPAMINIDAYSNNLINRDIGGWFWIGEQTGKWMESVSASKWYVKNDPVKSAKVDEILAKMKQAQTAEGYLGVGTPATVELNNPPRPIRGMDAYEMYSTLHSLLENYENYGNKDALDMASKLGDYFVAKIGPSEQGKYEFWPFRRDGAWQSKTIAGHDVHEGWEGTLLIDPVMRLYQQTGKQEYLDWVKWAVGNIDKWSDFTPFADLDKVASGEMGIDALQGYVHAHTFQMNFLGFLRLFEETGDSSLINKVIGAYNDIVNRQRFVTGTVSVGEHYEAGHNLPNEGSVGETCATNSWTRMCEELLYYTGDAEYADAIEQVLYNHMFATQTVDGDGYSYHRPLNGTTASFFTGPDCCSSSGMRIISLLPYMIYGKSDNEVFVNQYVQSEANIALKNGNTVNMKQITSYPESENIVMKVADTVSAPAVINVRMPKWVKNAVVKVNGEDISAQVVAGEFLEISRDWSASGDTIDISFPMQLEWVEGEYTNDGLWTMKRGPVVYSANTVFMTKEESLAAFGGETTGIGNIAYQPTVNGETVDAQIIADISDRAPKGAMGPFYEMAVKGYDEVGNLVDKTIVVSPFANIGTWYRGAARPANYNGHERYEYRVWVGADADPLPERQETKYEAVASYKFDSINGNKVSDVSGNGNDLTLFGSAAIVSDGDQGSVLNLPSNNTNGYAALPQTLTKGMYELSVSTLVKVENNRMWARIYNFSDQPNDKYLFSTPKNGSNKFAAAYTPSGGPSGESVMSAAMFPDNQYAHITTTYGGTTSKMYVNGVKVAEVANVSMLPRTLSELTNLWIGRSSFASDAYFIGKIDNFQVFNRVLSDAEVAQLATGVDLKLSINSIMPVDDVITPIGVAPVLPETVAVTYNNGTNGTAKATWDAIDPTKYAVKGQFTVEGAVEGTTQKASVTVIVGEVTPTGLKVIIDNIEMPSGKAGTKFQIPVKLSRYPTANGITFEGLLHIPDGLAVESITKSENIYATDFEYNTDADGNLRFAYINLTGQPITYNNEATIKDLMVLNMVVTKEKAPGEAMEMPTANVTVKGSDGVEEKFDVEDAQPEITVPTVEKSATARELYTGDGIDVVPAGKKAVAVDFTGLTGTPAVSFGDIAFIYSSEKSTATKTTYVALVDVGVTLESLNVVESYTVGEADAQSILFGDYNTDDVVNASDALAAVEAWLRKITPDDKGILALNVNAGTRIDTSDAISIIDKFLDPSKEFEVVVK